MKGILWQKVILIVKKPSRMHRLRTGDHSCSNWNIRKRVATRLGTLGKRVARSSWGIAKQVTCSSWGIGKRAARSSWGVPKQPTARSNDSLPISWQATFSSCINPWLAIKWARVRITLWYRFEDWAFSFPPLTPQLTQLYTSKWILGYRQWWKCECLVIARNCCMARMLSGEAELVSEWTGLLGKAKRVKRFERSNGLDTALYKNYVFTLSCLLCYSPRYLNFNGVFNSKISDHTSHNHHLYY